MTSTDYKITTVMALPGVGKSTYCKERAYKGIGHGGGHWAPEPTDDLAQLRRALSPEDLQRVLRTRFIARDSGICPAQWRDSDIWTSHLIFSGLGPENLPSELWIPVVSDNLILLLVDPVVQAERIRSRARPELWESELRFTKPYWRRRLELAYERHPAKNKIIVHA